MSGSNLCIPKNETVGPCYFQTELYVMFCLPISTFMYMWAGSLCLLTILLQPNRQTLPWNIKIAHKDMNVGIGNEAAHFISVITLIEFSLECRNKLRRPLFCRQNWLPLPTLAFSNTLPVTKREEWLRDIKGRFPLLLCKLTGRGGVMSTRVKRTTSTAKNRCILYLFLCLAFDCFTPVGIVPASHMWRIRGSSGAESKYLPAYFRYFIMIAISCCHRFTVQGEHCVANPILLL
jgi:hypothetical protein